MNLDVLWAKTSKDDCNAYHPLICHMIDVAMVCQSLWVESFTDGLRKWLADHLSVELDVAGKWIAFWAGAHDLGKASPGFQEKAPKESGLLASLKQSGFDFGVQALKPQHGVATASVLPDLLQKRGLPPELAQRVATAVGGHHGVFPRSEQVLDATDAVGRGLWITARESLLDLLADAIGLTASPPVPDPLPDHAFFLTLAGYVSVADWIGSNQQYFPCAGPSVDIGRYTEESKGRAKRAVDELRWTGWSPPDKSQPFSVLFPKIMDMRPLQTEAVELAATLDSPALVLVEAPTGEGKTEAAMYLADHWTATLKQRGCYFALPTQATSNQMFTRVMKFVGERYGDAESVNLMLLHGHAALSAEFEKLKKRGERLFEPGDIHDDDDAPANVLAAEWFTHRKCGLLAPFGVGTIDQALLAVLQTKHVFVRLFGLAHKTVILDEVHAYDAYMSTLLERLLEWLAALGCSVVLLSATLPKGRRRALLKAYAGKPETDVGEEEEEYPRLSWVHNGEIHAKHFPPAEERRSCLRLQWIPGDLESLGGSLKEALAEGGCTAVVCNTVGRAQEVYLALKKHFPPEELDLFHARFPFEERDKREQRALIRFGKPGDPKVKRPHRAILVATQVIEQSLDLDFDLMVTDLAPVDLMLQRAGRLHRHERQRKPRLTEPQLWVIEPEVDSEGIPDFCRRRRKYVYDSHILFRSWLALQKGNREVVNVPEDVEDLIGLVYDTRDCPEGLPDPLPMTWGHTWTKLRDDLDGDVDEAERRIIKPPGYSGALWRMIVDPLEEDSPQLHAAFQALTRLSTATVSIVCLYASSEGPRLKADGRDVIDLMVEPTGVLVEKLLRRSLSISHGGVVHALLENGRVPDKWRKCALLRNHHVVVFDSACRTQIGDFTLDLDEGQNGRGLVIGKANNTTGEEQP